MIVPTWLLMIHTVGCKHYSGSSNKLAIIPGNAVCLFTPTQTQRVLLNYFLDSSSLYFSVFPLFSSWLKCISVRPDFRSACRPLSLCRLFGVTGNCAACSKLIPAFEMVMRARDNVYHLDCFACQLCRQR